MIRTKRVYDPPSPDDGYRLLVMRLWPRGVRQDAVDGWEKDLAPSLDLLRGYQAGRVQWDEFARCYRAEVGERSALLDDLSQRSRTGDVTLLCGCRDESRCHRTLLREIVESPDGGTQD
ncbi:MAG: DUF488 family protein [Dehalococcoidia bacterium]